MSVATEARVVVLRMHRDAHGCWADSKDIPNWTIVGADGLEVMHLAHDGINNHPEVLDLTEPVDVRWQWCDTKLGVVALSGVFSPPAWRRECCACATGKPTRHVTARAIEV